MALSRRAFLRVVGAVVVGGNAFGAPAVIQAQTRRGIPTQPLKIGLLAIRTGVAAPVGAAGWGTSHPRHGGNE
jgi:hypothetical protein